VALFLMRILSEKGSLDFLEEEEFNVVPRKFFVTRFGLKRAIKEVGTKSTMEAIGRNSFVLEKEIEIPKNYTLAVFEFKRLKKLKGFKKISLKEKINGKNFFVKLEREGKKGSLSFSFLNFKESQPRILISKLFPINKLKLRRMIKNSKFPKTISKRVKANFENFVLNLYEFFKKDLKIKKIEIGSLFVNEKNSIVYSARVFLK